MRIRGIFIALIGAAVLALPSGSSAAVFESNGTRDASGVTLPGLVAAEGLGPGGKYVWFVDHLSGEDVLRGYDQTTPGAATQLATIQGTTGVGPGKIGTVTGIGFSPALNRLYIADNTNNRLIVYPRANDETANDPVDYAAGLSVTSFNQGGGFPVTDPKGLALDLHGGVYGYMSIRNDSDLRGLMVFNAAPNGGGIDWHKFVWDPSRWNTVNGPGALTVDSSTGNIYVAEDGLNTVKGYTEDVDGLAGTFTSTSPGDFISLAVDRSSNRLFAAKPGSVEVFSLETQRLLGSTTQPDLDQNVGLAQLEGSRKFFLSSTGAPVLRDLLAFDSPTCEEGPIDAVAGEITTIVPICGDADGSTIKEFEVTTQGEIGSASPSADYSAIEYSTGASSLGFDNFYYRVTTQDGQSGIYEQQVNVIPPDTTAPTVTITSPSVESTLDSSPTTLHFTVSDNRDSSPDCNYADGDEVPLDEGDNTITVSCTDDSGNTGTDSVSFTYVPPDTTDPVVEITAPGDGYVLGSSPVTLHFTVSDDRDDNLDCNRSDNDSIALTPGPNEIEVQCEDDAGNIGTDSVDVTYDNEAPEVTISAPMNGTVIDSSSTTLEYSVSDNYSSEPSCDHNNGDVVPLDVGSNLITVHCTDEAGNTGEASTTVTYDSDAPQLEITAPLDGALLTSSTVTLSYSLSDDTDTEPVCNLANGAAVALTPGPNLIAVSCTDHGGHQASQSVSVTYDADAPEVEITAPIDGAKTDKPQTDLRFTATDDVDTELACSRTDGATIPLVEGTNTITVTCTDDAGRIGTASAAVTYTKPAEVTALAEPVIRTTANLEPTTGEVFVKLPGSDKYIPLSQALLAPVGTIVDARNGTAKLTLANADGSTYEASFWGGIFQVFQGAGDQPIAIMKLRDDLVDNRDASTSAFKRVAANPFHEIQIARRGKKKNGLWGDGKGKFRTSGSGGSATVRGTKWYVANYENGTYFRVDRGIVNVRPTHGNCFDLKAGQTRFVEYKALTESQRVKKMSKGKSKPKKGCL